MVQGHSYPEIYISADKTARRRRLISINRGIFSDIVAGFMAKIQIFSATNCCLFDSRGDMDLLLSAVLSGYAFRFSFRYTNFYFQNSGGEV